MKSVCDVYLRGATREFDRPYTYAVPEELALTATQGSLVEIPFGRGNSTREGWIYQRRARLSSDPDHLKSIQRVVASGILRPDQFQLAQEMRRRYACSISQALSLMAPRTVISVGHKKERILRCPDEERARALLEEGALRSLGQIRVLEFVLDVSEATTREITSSLGVTDAVVSALVKKGILERGERVTERPTEPLVPLEERKDLTLNSEQKSALEKISDLSTQPSKQPLREALLFGVTGSGKTEVYLRAAEEVLAQGRDVIILVPEISLTPLIASRIFHRFGEGAAVFHSRLTPVERFEQWNSIASGKKHLVVGARSAIFAPLESIGLIIIDEEQETSYKSESTPRYQARDVARIRAMVHRATLLLVSATPSIESFYRTETGKSQLIRLSQRATGAHLPQTQVIDLRKSWSRGETTLLTEDLKEALASTFFRQEQAMIFLNRRGKNAYLLCADCGNLVTCPNCQVSLTEHLNPYAREAEKKRQLICHFCGLVTPVPSECPQCGGHNLQARGSGTQEMIQELEEAFPQQKFLRMDQDSTATRNGHLKILEQFARHEVDCLVGTQMIAKGHDFPLVTTVGIVLADQLLAVGDYTAEERAFQLICQASGRAGRGEKPGTVYLQTAQPNHPILKAAANQNYDLFYQIELDRRRLLRYPPFCEIGVAIWSGYEEDLVHQWVLSVEDHLQEILHKEGLAQTVRLYQPAPAPVPRIRKKWRWRMIVKSKTSRDLARIMTYLNDLKAPEGILFTGDTNPQQWF